MRYVSKCILKQMRLQPLSENVGTERWVSEVVGQHIAGHRTGDGECPTAKHAATMSWYDERLAAGRSKSLTTGVGWLQFMSYWGAGKSWKTPPKAMENYVGCSVRTLG